MVIIYALWSYVCLNSVADVLMNWYILFVVWALFKCCQFVIFSRDCFSCIRIYL